MRDAGTTPTRRWSRTLPRKRLERNVVWESALVLAGFTALVVALFWPLVSGIGHVIAGTDDGPDALAAVAWLWRLQQEGFRLFVPTTHFLTGAPIGWEEGSGLNLQWLLFYYPAYLATKVVGEVAAFNLLTLSGYVLSGVSMYALTRYLGCSRPVSAWAGLVFVVFPWHLEHVEHPPYAHLEVLVVLVLALAAAADRPTTLRFAVVGAATLVCWLAAGYFGAMAPVAAIAFALAVAVVLGRRGEALRFTGGIVVATVAGTVVLAAAAVASGLDSGAGLIRQVADLSIFGLRPTELVIPPADNIVVGSRLESFQATRLHGSNATESTNYLGLLTIGLATAWLVVAWRARALLSQRLRLATAGLVGVVVVALALAVPSPIGVLGAEWSLTPSRIFFELVPAFRVPSRWTALVMTALVPLAALGLHRASTVLEARVRGRTRGVVPVALVAGAMIFSFLELTIDPTEDLFRTRPVPPQYRAVSRAPEGVLAVYPLGHSDIYLLWQREHRRPLVNSPKEGTYADLVRRTLVDPRVPGTAPRLALLGVTAIVTWPDALDFESQSVPDVPDATWGPGYSRLAHFPDGSAVWRVTARPAPALVTMPTADFAEPVVGDEGTVWNWLNNRTGNLDIWSSVDRNVLLGFGVRPTGRRRETLVISGANGEISLPLSQRRSVTVPVSVREGHSRVRLTVEPAPNAGSSGLAIAAPWTRLTSAHPRIVAAPTKESSAPRIEFDGTTISVAKP